MSPLKKFVQRVRSRFPDAPLLTERILEFVDTPGPARYHAMAELARMDRDRRVCDPDIPSVQP